jgi:tetratricopeptide (TPR) repeat protein
MAAVELRRQYTRSDPRGSFPRLAGAPGIGYNRLAVYWRPLVDMAHSEVAQLSLRMIRPVSEWLADPAGRVSWFSRMSVPGLRRQVLRHAGLDAYDGNAPSDLPVELRTPAWQRLVDAVDGFAGLDPYGRALVVFQLAQLTLCQFAVRLTGLVPPAGAPGQDHYAYEVARVHSRIPGLARTALPVFEALAAGPDPLLAYHACFQGIAHGIRSLRDNAVAERFEWLGAGLPALPDSWPAHMTRTRYHRALARLRMAQQRPAEARDELLAARRHQDRMAELAPADPATGMIRDENLRDLLELRIEAVRFGVAAPPDQLRAWAAELVRIDPNAVEARLAAGDGYAAAGDATTAAHWYARAGELGTTAGANGWYRAGQCLHHLGDRDGALTAMGRCLELDTTAVEPREYLKPERTLT